MNTQDNQGNGWVGGSIGTGLGVVGGLSGAIPLGAYVQSTLSKKQMFEDRLNRMYDNSEYTYSDAYRKAANKVGDMQEKARAKASPYALSAMALLALGLPITTGLLGASLTD